MSINDPSEVSEVFEEQKAVVQRWLDMVQGNQDEVWDSYKTMQPDMKWTLIGSTVISGTHEGLEAIENDFFGKCWSGDGRPGQSVQGLDQEYGVRLDIDEMVALEDGRIMVICRSDGMGRNGVPYRNQYCWIITVRDGKMAALVEYCDTALIERAMFDKKLVPAETPAPVPAQRV
jgi:ketosteroid isomerase-like protein